MPSAVQLRTKKEAPSTKTAKSAAKSAPGKSAPAKTPSAKRAVSKTVIDKTSVVVAAPDKTENVMCVELRHKMISEAAYYLAEKNGFNSERALEYWLMAEKEIDAKIF